MRRPGVNGFTSLPLTMRVLVLALGLCMLLAPSACGAPPGSQTAPSRVSAIKLTIETNDGKVYTYIPSHALNAIPYQATAPSEGWSRSLFRSITVGVAVSLALLGISEVLSWLKRRYANRALKDKARHKVRERRRLLRQIYAAQEELQNLEEEMRGKDDGAEASEQERAGVSAAQRARKQELLFKIEDLRYQLQDLYAHSTGRLALAGGSEESSGSVQDESTGRDPFRIRNAKGAGSPLRHSSTANDETTRTATNWVEAARRRRALAKRRDVLGTPAATDLRHEDQSVKRSEKSLRGGGLPGLEASSRVEVVRQLLEEVPGMAPEEILRIAEKASKPSP